MKKLLVLLVFSVWIVLYMWGAFLYSGSSLVFAFFSIVYFILLISAVFYNVSYGYMFFAVMLWLGFWLKTVVHLAFDYPFVEPVGYFDGLGGSWDNVLLLASVGALGVIGVRLAYYGFFGSFSTMNMDAKLSSPGWYVDRKTATWSVVILSLVVVSVLNFCFSFQQIGIVPKVIVWPLNAIVSWLLTNGFIMAIVTLLWWEYSSSGNRNTAYFIFVEAAMSTVSLLSRGVYIFHSVPVVLAVFLGRKRLKWFGYKWFLGLMLAFVFLFFACYPLVNAARDYYYSSLPFSISAQYDGAGGKALMKIIMFSVDRWIGVEGLMATSAYPEKSAALFFSVLTERGGIGKISTFQEVALSHYRYLDASRFAFASLPGSISFFYLSGSPWVVVIGMMIVTVLVMGSEIFVHKLLHNPLLSAYWGGLMASAFSQMGVNVPGFAFYFFLCVLGVIFLYLLKEYFSAVLSILKNNRLGSRGL